METSLKTDFAQIFSHCPKNLSCPKFGGAAAPPAPPARTPMSSALKAGVKTLHGKWNSQTFTIGYLNQERHTSWFSCHQLLCCHLFSISVKCTKCICICTYYCSSVWHFCGARDADKLEALNKRIERLRFTFTAYGKRQTSVENFSE